MSLTKFIIPAVSALIACAGTASAVNFSGSYSENFDGLGTTGTTPPTGFSLFVGEGGSNSTWTNTTGITANGTTLSVASMVATSGNLTASAAPTATNNNGYNAANPNNANDRILATSPTSIDGGAINLSLTNTTGAALSTLSLGYDVQRFTSVATANELPGYQVFVNIDGGAWSQIPVFTPTLDGANGTVAVPNTVGVTSVPLTAFNLPSAWNANSTLNIRWVDDNAVQTSPDQIIGLNNVTIVPEPSAWMVSALGILSLVACQQRRRARS